MKAKTAYTVVIYPGGMNDSCGHIHRTRETAKKCRVYGKLLRKKGEYYIAGHHFDQPKIIRLHWAGGETGWDF